MKYKTLTAGDESLARERLRYLLQGFKNDIDIQAEAANGKEALEKLGTEKFDLVFLDIQMPGLTGLEVLEKISDPPFIIFVTAFHQYVLKAFE